MLVDKKEISNISSHKTRLTVAVASIDANCPLDYKVRVKEKDSAPLEIPNKYKE